MAGFGVLAIVFAISVGGQPAAPEFLFDSDNARTLLRQVRQAHGLLSPVPVALLGTIERGTVTDRGEITFAEHGTATDHEEIVIDARARKKLYRQLCWAAA